MSTARGESTGAVFGFVSKLFSVLRDYRPDGVAVAFDKGDTWRHAEFTEYKATRDAMPDDMRPQMDRIEQVLDALRIPTVSLETTRPTTCSARWRNRPPRPDTTY